MIEKLQTVSNKTPKKIHQIDISHTNRLIEFFRQTDEKKREKRKKIHFKNNI